MANKKTGRKPSSSTKSQPSLPPPAKTTIEKSKVADETQARTSEERKDTADLTATIKKGEVWLIGINAALLVANVVIASIYYRQLTAMRESNTINRESLVTVQRAFLNMRTIVGGPFFGPGQTGYTFTTDWENSGSTPAIGVINYFGIVEKGIDDDKISTFPFVAEKDTVYQMSVVGPKATDTVGTRYEPDGFWMPVTTTRHIAFWGYRLYRDVFPGTDVHLTEFCEYLMNTYKSIPTTSPHFAATPWSFSFSECPVHNCSDQDCKDYGNLKALYRALKQ
jgi:hypothetical protein